MRPEPRRGLAKPCERETPAAFGRAADPSVAPSQTDRRGTGAGTGCSLRPPRPVARLARGPGASRLSKRWKERLYFSVFIFCINKVRTARPADVGVMLNVMLRVKHHIDEKNFIS